MAAKLAVLLPEGARCSCKAARAGAGGGSYKAIALATAGWLDNAPMRGTPAPGCSPTVCTARPTPPPTTSPAPTTWARCGPTARRYDQWLHALPGDPAYLDDALAIVDGIWAEFTVAPGGVL